jgi:hypothetical protein
LKNRLYSRCTSSVDAGTTIGSFGFERRVDRNLQRSTSLFEASNGQGVARPDVRDRAQELVTGIGVVVFGNERRRIDAAIGALLVALKKTSVAPMRAFSVSALCKSPYEPAPTVNVPSSGVVRSLSGG